MEADRAALIRAMFEAMNRGDGAAAIAAAHSFRDGRVLRCEVHGDRADAPRTAAVPA